MTNKGVPKGKVKVIGAEPRRAPNKAGAWVNVIVEDEEGKRWFFQAASFCFDMLPVGEPDGN